MKRNMEVTVIFTTTVEAEEGDDNTPYDEAYELIHDTLRESLPKGVHFFMFEDSVIEVDAP